MVARAGPRPGEEHPTVAAPARGGQEAEARLPCPPPTVQEAATEGAERDRRSGSPPSSAQEACWVQAEETARGEWDSRAGAAKYVSVAD